MYGRTLRVYLTIVKQDTCLLYMYMYDEQNMSTLEGMLITFGYTAALYVCYSNNYTNKYYIYGMLAYFCSSLIGNIGKMYIISL